MEKIERQLLFHPSLSLVELQAAIGTDNLLHTAEIVEIDRKLKSYSKGLAKKNIDIKYLAGFSNHNLIELRWSFELASGLVPVRLVGAEKGWSETIFLRWHVKDTSQDLVTQRFEQNNACIEAVERMNTIESRY
jgi:hypothetical protein